MERERDREGEGRGGRERERERVKLHYTGEYQEPKTVDCKILHM